MRVNGSLEYAVVTGGGVNEYGEAVPSVTGWSEPVPCSIMTVSDTRLGTYEDGEFRKASFQIMIEVARFPYGRIRLERLGEDLGEYRVISATPLATVGRTKIVV